jgi:hypothetical protein
MAERSRDAAPRAAQGAAHGDAQRAPHRLHVVRVLRSPGERLFRDWLAITLGRHIWAWRPLSPSELAHEVTHVRQWVRHGWFFPAAYALASVRALMTGGHWYRDNAFEKEARASADEVARSTTRPS